MILMENNNEDNSESGFHIIAKLVIALVVNAFILGVGKVELLF